MRQKNRLINLDRFFRDAAPPKGGKGAGGVGDAKRGVGNGGEPVKRGKGSSGGSKGEAMKTARTGGKAKARGSKTGKEGASACSVREGMGNPKPPAGGSEGQAPAPKGSRSEGCHLMMPLLSWMNTGTGWL